MGARWPSVFCAALLAAPSCCLVQPPPPPPTRTAVIEVNGTATDADDFLCWSPVPARIRLTSPEASPVEVTVKGEAAPGGGAVAFQAGNVRPSSATFALQPLESQPEGVSDPQRIRALRKAVSEYRAARPDVDLRDVERRLDRS